jgi:hypothetical protein
MPKVYIRTTTYEVSVWSDGARDQVSTAMNARTWALTVEDRGRGLWAVMRGPYCLDADGALDREPQPSSREDDWLAAHRFTLDEALALAREHAPKVTVNGMTALEVLAGMGGAPVPDLMRTGRTLSQTPGLCTLYLVTPGDDRKADKCVGMAATTELAEWIAASVNWAGIPAPQEDR